MAEFALKTTLLEIPATQRNAGLLEPLVRVLQYWTEAGLSLQGIRLVGGLPRTLLVPNVLGHKISPGPGLDVDLVMESNAVEAASRLHSIHGGELVVHGRFATATWQPPGHVLVPTMDFITARTETYREPGQLPEVTPGTFVDDCFRRDITVNTLALDFPSVPQLCSGFRQALFHHHPSALRDLRKRVVRTLHPNSFKDDPTRLFRAARYEQRLGFRMSGKTLNLFESAVDENHIANISASRIRREIELVFLESRVEQILTRLNELGVMPAIGLDGVHASRGYEACANIPETDPDRVHIAWQLVLGTIGRNATSAGLAFGLRPKLLRQVEEFRTLMADGVLAAGGLSPMELVRRIGFADPLVLRSLQAYFPHLRQQIHQMIIRSDASHPHLGGRDLIQMGVPSWARDGANSQGTEVDAHGRVFPEHGS